MISVMTVFSFPFFVFMLCLFFLFCFFFFFKQKTAYELRISDWSSDVCSSDLRRRRGVESRLARGRRGRGESARAAHHPARLAGQRGLCAARCDEADRD